MGAEEAEGLWPHRGSPGECLPAPALPGVSIRFLCVISGSLRPWAAADLVSSPPTQKGGFPVPACPKVSPQSSCALPLL